MTKQKAQQVGLDGVEAGVELGTGDREVAGLRIGSETVEKVTTKEGTTEIVYISGSQPVGRDPLGSSTTFSQGLPKTIRKHRYLHYDS